MIVRSALAVLIFCAGVMAQIDKESTDSFVQFFNHPYTIFQNEISYNAVYNVPLSSQNHTEATVKQGQNTVVKNNLDQKIVLSKGSNYYLLNGRKCVKK